MVMAAARTGRDSSRSTTVTKVAHTNKGIRAVCSPSTRIFRMVAIKLMAPKMEEIPAK